MPTNRYHINSHIYGITTNIYNQLNLFTRSPYTIPLYDSLNFYRYKRQFKLIGYVFMPDHIYLLIWPSGQSSVSEIMRDYKKFTAVRIIRQAEMEHADHWITAFERAGRQTQRSKRKVWQDSYWDKNVFSEKFLRQKLNYIHRNPVRAGLVEKAEDYPYSSYRNYIFNDHSLIEIDFGWQTL